ncbi:MAG: 16S rRNA processing protein RimM [Burkholderiales bacterium]|nr:16S rRNA processing protein RimM [Burkholderiales bacterium]
MSTRSPSHSTGGVDERLVVLAKVGRPYGLTGALHLYPYSASAETLLRADALTIGSANFAVHRARRHGDSVVAQLVGIDTPEAAARLTNQEVAVPRSTFAPLPEGEYYWVDLIGLTCSDGEREFGTIVEVFDAGAQPILRVRSPSGERDELIPFVDAIVRSVDLAARRVDVDWPGLD